MADTRAEILRVAAEEFGRRGYGATSVQRIAARVGLTKAAVLYHFPEKADLLLAVAAPMLEGMEALLEEAGALPPERARWRVIEGLLDLMIAHRELLRMSLKDLSLSAATFVRWRNAMLRANELVAGPRPRLAEKVRAAQALAALGDPVVLFESPLPQLREEVLRGVRLLLEHRPGEDQPREDRPARVRRRGRPATVDAAMAERARRLYDKGLRPDEIARQLGISRATLYRHLK